MALEFNGKKDLYLPVTDVRNQLKSRACPDQTEHNDFEVWKGWSLGFAFLDSASDVLRILLCQSLHIFMYNSRTKKNLLVELLCLESSYFDVFCFN